MAIDEDQSIAQLESLRGKSQTAPYLLNIVVPGLGNFIYGQPLIGAMLITVSVFAILLFFFGGLAGAMGGIIVIISIVGAFFTFGFALILLPIGLIMMFLGAGVLLSFFMYLFALVASEILVSNMVTKVQALPAKGNNTSSSKVAMPPKDSNAMQPSVPLDMGNKAKDASDEVALRSNNATQENISSLPTYSPESNKRGIAVAFGVAVVLIGGLYFLLPNPNNVINDVHTANLSDLTGAVQESQFAYANATTEIQKTGIRRDRDAKILQVVPDGKFSNWLGTIRSITTRRDGDASISIKLDGCECGLITADGNEITAGSSLFEKLRQFNEGDQVLVSGQFFAESSITEWGSIVDPEWYTRFDDVSFASSLAPTPAVLPPIDVPESKVSALQEPAASEYSDQSQGNQAGAPQQTQAVVAPDNSPFMPSFDCTRALTGQERLICSDRDLAKLDVDLYQAYIRARDASADVASLRASQLDWLKNSRNACSDKNCMLSAYTSRMSELMR